MRRLFVGIYWSIINNRLFRIIQIRGNDRGNSNLNSPYDTCCNRIGHDPPELEIHSLDARREQQLPWQESSRQFSTKTISDVFSWSRISMLVSERNISAFVNISSESYMKGRTWNGALSDRKLIPVTGNTKNQPEAWFNEHVTKGTAIYRPRE